MILLDNYMLLTRDEEQGRLVVVSRVSTRFKSFRLRIALTSQPIHLDFLNIITADGAPERRHDNISSRWKPNGQT